MPSAAEVGLSAEEALRLRVRPLEVRGWVGDDGPVTLGEPSRGAKKAAGRAKDSRSGIHRGDKEAPLSGASAQATLTWWKCSMYPRSSCFSSASSDAVRWLGISKSRDGSAANSSQKSRSNVPFLRSSS